MAKFESNQEEFTTQTQSVENTDVVGETSNLQSINEKLVDQSIKISEEHWVKSYWRPAMGWLYMIICLVDFVIFPLFSMFTPVIYKMNGVNGVYIPWQSLTLSNGGLIHLSFGAILGVAAWSRGKEKLMGVA